MSWVVPAVPVASSSCWKPFTAGPQGAHGSRELWLLGAASAGFGAVLVERVCQ